MSKSEHRFLQCELTANEDLGAGNRLLRVAVGDDFDGAAVLPGQFVMLRGPWGMHPLLPRAFSVLAGRPGELELLVKVVGRGTRLLAAAEPGAAMTVLGPLGRPFPAPADGVREVLVGGGSGIPPLVMQALRARALGHTPGVEVIYGGRSGPDLALLDRIEGAGLKVLPCTEDGSVGARGRVTDVLRGRLEPTDGLRVLACGPTPMLAAVSAMCAERGVECLLSLETEMACGIGLCKGCSVARPEGGYHCACKDGPVFRAEEVVL
jgi:dihydroorotate dehydrogenase electron transfer subunit